MKKCCFNLKDMISFVPFFLVMGTICILVLYAGYLEGRKALSTQPSFELNPAISSEPTGSDWHTRDTDGTCKEIGVSFRNRCEIVWFFELDYIDLEVFPSEDFNGIPLSDSEEYCIQDGNKQVCSPLGDGNYLCEDKMLCYNWTVQKARITDGWRR